MPSSTTMTVRIFLPPPFCDDNFTHSADGKDYLEFMPVKADATVRLAKMILAAGAPLHGIGFQGHITLGQTPTRENMTWTLNKFTALGLDVAYTELDMRIKGVAINAASLEQQAKEYEAVVGSCVDVPRCVGVTV